MQLFIPYRSPIESALCLDDKRIMSSILESTQMMCCALRINGYPGTLPVKTGWIHHPLSKWTAQSWKHFIWVRLHLGSLLWEFEGRFRHKHKYESYDDFYLTCNCHKHFKDYYTYEAMASREIYSMEFQKAVWSIIHFRNCTLFKGELDIEEAYRKHLSYKWQNSKPKWTKRKCPDWYFMPVYCNYPSWTFPQIS